MTTTVQLIEACLTDAFQPTFIAVKDDREEHIGHANQDSGHFSVIIQAALFAGKNAIARHRMIYTALGPLMQTHIHALSIQASTPDEN